MQIIDIKFRNYQKYITDASAAAQEGLKRSKNFEKALTLSSATCLGQNVVIFGTHNFEVLKKQPLGI